MQNFMAAMQTDPVTAILMVIIIIFMIFWVGVSFAIGVSQKARDTFQSFIPQWFNRKGRPFTSHEKVGIAFQGVILLMIIALIFM